MRHERRSTARGVLVDRQLCFTEAPYRGTASTLRTMALVMEVLIKNVLLCERVTRFGGAVVLTVAEDAYGEARRDGIIGDAYRTIDRALWQIDVTPTGKRSPV